MCSAGHKKTEAITYTDSQPVIRVLSHSTKIHSPELQRLKSKHYNNDHAKESISISNLLKKDNQGKEQELKETQAEINELYIGTPNARSLHLDDEFTAEESKEIKTDLTRRTEELEKKKTKLLSTDDNYQEYLSQGGEIMKNIANRYVSASPIGKKQILGLIFAEKLIFSDNKFRTTVPNVFPELIKQAWSGLRRI
ncbi:hypothetical protein [Chitinophaga pinensis]|uniref:hypothetical protein n=1 Tax=Chitinophaga pinensis TaxID=79329 RepID=UPI0021BCFC6E|nr:hypothetical protein [Chitinophaga pinensis]